MSRVYNFSPGPSVLPEPVLRRAAGEMLEYGSSGQSVMEMSHRSPEYEAILADTEERLRRVMGIPQEYAVLLLQGGATMQFSMVPMNLLGEGGADYVVSGMFSQKAFQEAARLFPGRIRAAASSEADGFSGVPHITGEMLDGKASYLHICQNNTIYGTRFVELPPNGAVPLVADLSSCILSEPIDVTRYGLIYAGAQKNMAPAGLCVVIVRRDLLERCPDSLPTMMNYRIQAENGSMYNTPPTYTIYMMGLVLQWVEEEMGGLAGMQKHNVEKAAILYEYLDRSRLFQPKAKKEYRSLMNVTFVTSSAELDQKFCREAQENGLYNLKGHRAVGGMRTSIYNAMPREGVEKLVAFMEDFEARNS